MEKIDSRLIQSVILLDRQFSLTDHLISSQSYVLKNFEQAIERKEQTLNHVLDVYNYVFALIDHLERYRKIALSIPKFSHKSPEYRALVSAVGDIEAARHEIQHVNNKIENDYTGHLLGNIFWISQHKQYIASFHDVGRERSTLCPIFDTKTGRFIHEFCYVYNKKYYDLQKAIDGIKIFNQYINSTIKIKIDSRDYNINDHFSALCVEFSFTLTPSHSK